MRFALVLVLLFACNRAEAPPVEIAPVALPSTSVAHEDPPDAAPQPANVAVATPSGQTDGPVLADPPPRAIQGVVAASRSKLRNCFNQKLKTDPNASGKVVYSLRLAANGTVTSTSMVSNTFSDMQVATCIEQVLRTLQFPAATQETTVQIPFVFTSATP